MEGTADFKSEFKDIQAFVDSIKVPPNVGRIPHKFRWIHG